MLSFSSIIGKYTIQQIRFLEELIVISSQPGFFARLQPLKISFKAGGASHRSHFLA